MPLISSSSLYFCFFHTFFLFEHRYNRRKSTETKHCDINGTISHERFLKLSAEYEAEQRELTEKVNAEQKEVDTCEQDKNDFDSFVAIIRKYVGITELTPTIVNEFIKKIIVHAPEKKDVNRFQKVDIVFNFVGEIHLPTDPHTKQKEAAKQEKTT